MNSPRSLRTPLLLLTLFAFPVMAQDERLEMSDGEILQVMKVLNDGEIQQAEMAQEKSDDDHVKSAAQLIIADHERADEQIESLSGQGLELRDSSLSQSLQAQARQSSQRLDGMEGEAFNCAYLEIQATMHELALDTVATQLLPQAEAEEVKEFLTNAEGSLEHHLHTAQTGLEAAGCGNA